MKQKTVTTPKGTLLPLMNLKGKDYLQVAYRIQWFTEEVPRFTIDTNFLTITSDETVASVTVCEYNEQGQLMRKAQGTKREIRKDFSDHTEKAETGALGRALIQLGFGTQFALSDLDEGTRIVDSPVVSAKPQSGDVASNETVVAQLSSAPVFVKPTTSKFATEEEF